LKRNIVRRGKNKGRVELDGRLKGNSKNQLSARGKRNDKENSQGGQYSETEDPLRGAQQKIKTSAPGTESKTPIIPQATQNC